MTDIDVKIQWHSPEQMYAAVFMRDGEPWYLDGALVGMGATPARAVGDLTQLAEHLVLKGENFLTPTPLTLEDRRWLFDMLDEGSSKAAEMYTTLRWAQHEA